MGHAPDLSGMRLLPGGVFAMGSARFYPEERPVRQVAVQPFWIDELPVTVADFARFVQETGHVTVAERGAPGLPGPGSAVFVRPAGPVDMADPSQWWAFRPGASWRDPLGERSPVQALDTHPVVHVAWSDAQAYAAWAGKQLPTEAQWEYACRGGLDGADYAWGHELAPGGLMLANYWQGEFPHSNTLADGWERTSPVGAFPANGWGLYDMVGNVWEWTLDDWALPAAPSSAGPRCCQAGVEAANAHRKVIKGGSHLCALNHCQRFRPAARHPQAPTESTSHIGFRCVIAAEYMPG